MLRFRCLNAGQLMMIALSKGSRGAWLALIWLLALCASPAGAAPKADLWDVWDASAESNQASIDHGSWQAFLDKYVRPGPDAVNRVAYAAVTPADRSTLNGYVQMLARLDPREFARREQFAYWVNLYNALTVQVVLAHPDKPSILRMGGRLLPTGPWDDELISIAQYPVTLNDIEHRILRPIWRDRRIHYAVNCASIGCPNLNRQAYTAANANELLAASEIAYINHPRGVRFDGRDRLIVSQIYRWYREDFAADQQGLLAYLAEHHAALAARLRGYRATVRYAYDWSLNSAE